MHYMMFFRILIISLMMTGCATYKMTVPAPVKSDTISIKYNNKKLSGWSDLPMGTYSVPNSQVIISGHQKGGGAGLLFGVIGVAVQGAINSAGGEDAIENLEKRLQISLTSQAQSATEKLIAEKGLESRFTTSSDQIGETLSVSSAVIITFVNDTDVRPYVLLKANLTDSHSSKAIWSTRYIASTGKPHPLAGSDSFTSGDGALLKSTITKALENAIKFMLADISSPQSRDNTQLTKMQSYFPYVKQQIETVGYVVGEDEESIVFIPKLGDVMTFSGVNIIDKSMAIYREANKNDSYFKIVDAP